MAQTIQCDPHAGEHPADWLVTHIEDGESLAYCNAAYLELMTDTVRAADQAEADQTAAEVEARLAGGLVGQGADPDEAAAYAHEATQRQLNVDGKTGPARTVRKGQSAKARQAQRRAFTERTNAIAKDKMAAAGPDDDEDNDEDEAQRAEAQEAAAERSNL